MWKSLLSSVGSSNHWFFSEPTLLNRDFNMVLPQALLSMGCYKTIVKLQNPWCPRTNLFFQRRSRGKLECSRGHIRSHSFNDNVIGDHSRMSRSVNQVCFSLVRVPMDSGVADKILELHLWPHTRREKSWLTGCPWSLFFFLALFGGSVHAFPSCRRTCSKCFTPSGSNFLQEGR